MELKYNRSIHITVGASRKDTHWRNQELTVAELYDRLKVPIRGTETLDQYFRMKKNQQDDLKDVGGFVGGTLTGERRKANAITGRDVISLDFDTIPPLGTDGILQTLDSMGCSFCAYSTRKHVDNAPRLRIILPLDRTVTADEYEPIARFIAAKIGIQYADPTTFEPSRLMYWPSCCSDGVYIYRAKDAPMISADGVLGTYQDWRDVTAWPNVPGTVAYQKMALKQGVPEEKPGTVGAFNRTYNIFSAMDQFLPGIYAPVDNDPGRFTYLNGSTTGGAVIYEDGRFLYSHHATDPCSGRLVNAFDLVRLHKFGEMDDNAKVDTPFNRMPSYRAMCDFAMSDKKVATLIIRERQEQAVQDFAGVAENQEEEPPTPDAEVVDWRTRLDINPQSGLARPTIDNILLILENDPLLRGKFALNEFANRGEVLDVLPWDKKDSDSPHIRLWSDTDSNGLYWYMEKCYAITGRANIDAALDIHAARHSFNNVKDYLTGLKWDGFQRLDTLFINYLGAYDSAYTRAVCRKVFVAAVKRAMEPGCKFDCMVILCGPQGIGKSTLLDRMSRGWFNDSIRSFEGKEAAELLPGVWLVEIAELDAFRRTDVSRIKQFLSLRADRYRAAYGRNMREFPRSCVFFGTCNQMDFLQDTTGNRRFWPVDVGFCEHPYRAWSDLTDAVVDQLWAEAVVRWREKEPVYLEGDVEQESRQIQEGHRDVSPQEGVIIDFVNKLVPEDWLNWPLNRRRDFWAGGIPADSYKLVPREYICAAEVWCEALNGQMRDLTTGNRESRAINAVLSKLPDFERAYTRFGKEYGVQRGFRRCNKQ